MTKNMAEERTLYPSNVTDYLCRACADKRIARTIEGTRRALGLETRETPEGP